MNNTYRDFKNVLLVIICTASLVVIGCRGILDRITPAEEAPQVGSYLDRGSKDFTSLFDLRRDRDAIIIKHREGQISLKRLAQDDKRQYQDVITFVDEAIEESQQFQDLVVGSEDQPFSILGVLAGFAGGAAIGRALKRKGDLTPEEARTLNNKERA